MTTQEAAKVLQAFLAGAGLKYMSLYMPMNKEVEAIRVAITALEKQVPKSPTEYDECPTCGGGTAGGFEKYCVWCGQHLDWGRNKNDAAKSD